MKKYVVKRILSLIPVLFIVSIVIFTLIHLTPGDPAAAMLGDQATEGAIAQLREKLGLNDPLPLQYLHWIRDIFQGDLGTSLFIDGSMWSILMGHMKPTLALTMLALLFAVLFSVPLGIMAARHRGTLVDQTVSVISILGVSIPSFLLGLLLILGLAVGLKLLPAAGYKTVSGAGLWNHIRYLILPAISLGFIEAGLMIRMTRSAMLEVLSSDYIRMAKAKGVANRVIFNKHALKNALVQIITVVGQSFMVLLGGATVTESVFNIPGIGKLTLNSVMRRDYEVVQAVVLLISVTNVLVCLVVDLLYGLVDPRVRAND